MIQKLKCLKKLLQGRKERPGTKKLKIIGKKVNGKA
jgi:hypothetical protein